MRVFGPPVASANNLLPHNRASHPRCAARKPHPGCKPVTRRAPQVVAVLTLCDEADALLQPFLESFLLGAPLLRRLYQLARQI